MDEVASGLESIVVVVACYYSIQYLEFVVGVACLLLAVFFAACLEIAYY